MSKLKSMATSAFMAAVLIGGFVASRAEAASYIPALGKGTNDGVFDLTAGQDAFLGVSCTGTCEIGFYRVRPGSSFTASVGDYFDATSFLNSMQNTTMSSNILGVFNGPGPLGTGTANLSYTGSVWDPLGTTTVDAIADSYAAIAFVWDSTVLSSIVFNHPTGSTTFSTSRGLQSLTSPQFVPSATPLPGALPLLASGLGALGLLGWRRKRKASAIAAA